MTTEKLFEFLVLSRTLNYSRAAKKLFITQSALSRHIMEMEQELGVTLLRRSTHGVKLTDAGRILAQRSQHLIHKSESALSRLRVGDSEMTGSVSVACLESVPHTQLMIFASQFTAKFPKIDLRIDALEESERMAALDTHDFTFTTFELQNLPENIYSAAAFTTPGALYVLANHHLISSHHIVLDQLAGETLIVPYADEVFCSYALNRQLAEKQTGYKLNILKVPTTESALMMTALGKGVAILPRNFPQTTALDVWGIDILTPGCVFDTYLYWNRTFNNPTAKLMLDELAFFTNTQGE